MALFYYRNDSFLVVIIVMFARVIYNLLCPFSRTAPRESEFQKEVETEATDDLINSTIINSVEAYDGSAGRGAGASQLPGHGGARRVRNRLGSRLQ